MTLEKLRVDIKNKCDYSVYPLGPEQAERLGLSKLSPARLTTIPINKWVIYLFAELEMQDRIEAEAHELAHLLVMYEDPSYASVRIVKADDQENDEEYEIESEDEEDNNDISYLSDKINNAISHKLLIPKLAIDYGIKSDLHFRCLAEGLIGEHESIKSANSDAILHGIGLSLHDISSTCPQLAEDAEKVANLNPEVKRAFNASNSFFTDIHTVSIVEQKKRITDFMASLRVSSRSRI